MLWVGTSGFQYPEWRGKFYPQAISAAKMLEFYAAEFNSTESNYTFRRVPTVAAIRDWARRTPARFRFSLKAPQQITHIRRLRDCDAIVKRFWTVGQNLERKLGAILFQLPPFLRKDAPLLDDFTAGLPRGMRAAFEFRHESWFSDDVFSVLKKQSAALCIADSEKIHSPVVYTANFAYFRLRDEGYTTRDIKRWAKTISQQPTRVKDTFVYFKHEEKALGPKFAKLLLAEM